MEADAGNARHEHERDRDRLIDWLEQSPDLPHLIARVSEIVHRLGYAPDDLVVLPRRELDRRELAAYSAGWADVVAEQLPPIRKAYEERITAAYLQGQEDARTGRRPRRARRAEGTGGGGDGDVIPLPYVPLLDPPRVMTRVEERGERERTLAENGGRGDNGGRAEGGLGTEGGGRIEGGRGAEKGRGAGDGGRIETGRGTGAGGGAEGEDRAEGGRDAGGGGRIDTGRGTAGGRGAGGRGRIETGRGAEGAGSRKAAEGAGPGKRPEADILVSAREVRDRQQPATPDRRRVVRRNGRPSVPPLARPGEPAGGTRERVRTEGPEPRDPDRPRLSEKARALADELEGRAAASARGKEEKPAPQPGSR